MSNLVMTEEEFDDLVKLARSKPTKEAAEAMYLWGMLDNWDKKLNVEQDREYIEFKEGLRRTSEQ